MTGSKHPISWREFDPEYPEGIENLPLVKRDEHGNIILQDESSGERDSTLRKEVVTERGDEMANGEHRVSSWRDFNDEAHGVPREEESSDSYILQVFVISLSPGGVDVPGLLEKRVNAALKDLEAEGTPGFRVELGSYDVFYAGNYKNIPLAMISYWAKKSKKTAEAKG